MNTQTDIAGRVETGTLSNGVKIYLLENHANTTVEVVGLLEGGLYLESPERAGVADLTFGMLDRGTRHRSERAIADALESNGILLRYVLSRETTLVRGRCLSEDLPLLTEIMGETLCEPAFPDDQIRLTKEEALVTLREATFDTFEQAYRRAAAQSLGASHPYARDPVGEEKIVESLGVAELTRHHKHAVSADRLSLAVVGDIEPDTIRALLEKHLGPLDSGKGSVDRSEAGGGASSPTNDGAFSSPTISKVTKSERADARPQQKAGEKSGLDPGSAPRPEHVEIPDKEQVDLVFLRPGVARSDPGFEANGLANFVLGGSFVSRLNRRLRDDEGLTYGVRSAISSGLAPGCWFTSIGVHSKNLDQATESVIDEMRTLAAEGVGEEELELARQHLTGSFPLRLETNQAVAAVLLEGVRSGRGLDYIDRYPARLREISRAQVNEAARTLFDTGDLVVVSAGTLKAGSGA